MGIYNPGIPEDDAKFFKKLYRLSIFVEGGTYMGYTARKMADLFEKVFTIEKSDKIYLFARENLQNVKNVILIKGDTREHFYEILQQNDNILFWLDAHWSGGDTYGVDDECPLIDELRVIFNFPKNYVIFIDDARLFLAPPPYPHKYSQWPSIKDIINIVPKNFDIIIYKDVIYVYRINPEYDYAIKEYFQKKTTKDWKEYERKQIYFKAKNFLTSLFKKK